MADDPLATVTDDDADKIGVAGDNDADGGTTVGLEDIVFLMRKDKVTLVRLLRHFSFKDAVPSLHTTMNQEPTQQQQAEPTKSKRVKICVDFLNRIDSSGELISSFTEDFVDEIKHNRNLVSQRRFFMS